MMEPRKRNSPPKYIEVRGARLHNLKNINVNIPLGKFVAVAGVSGSGKSSLALGILYAEGSRRYLEALSTYTRRRLSQPAKAPVDEIKFIPPAIALHQRPTVPGIRSTFGTSTELLNSLRLMFSRLGEHRCPNGHLHPPTLDVARGMMLTCPVCHVVFEPPGAESFAFNSDGACPECNGTGIIRKIDDSTIVANPDLSIEQGAVEPWKMFGLAAMPKTVAEFGVRIDVPFRQLSDEEKKIVFDGPEEKRMILWHAKNGKLFELNSLYRNAHKAVEDSLKNAGTQKGLERVNKYFTLQTCPSCHGTRLSEKARSSLLQDKNLAEVTAMTLAALEIWLRNIPAHLPAVMKSLAESIMESYLDNSRVLLSLGLSYLTLDRASSTLSTGERQRIQLSRAVRNQTTGALYVLDEPSIGLHPSNIEGLLDVIADLIADGNSVVLVDHDTQVLRQADWMVEIGPGAGNAGGNIIASGTVNDVEKNPDSKIGGFLSGTEKIIVRPQASASEMFDRGTIRMSTLAIHTVKPLELALPKGRLIAVTGVSGSGKTTLILESLKPAMEACISGTPLPKHIKSIHADGITKVNLIDASPIGINVRSTISTYTGILDDLRKIFALTQDAKTGGFKAADFSYNTGKLRCPTCEGTGQISLDVQFLPDVDIICPTCHGTRYSAEADKIRYRHKNNDGSESDISLPELMQMTVDNALEEMKSVKKIKDRLKILSELGLGYLTLGEATPSLSGGEAQRLKLASEMGKAQNDTLFIFDEPTIGLHPLDVRGLIQIFEKLVNHGATVIVIEHDLDMIANADYVVDMGPGGGNSGGEVVALGTPDHIKNNTKSITGRYLTLE